MEKRKEVVSEKEVIELLKKKRKPLAFSDLAKILGIEKKERKNLKKILKKLKKIGKIKIIKGKFLWSEEEKVTGTVIPYPAGFGFLSVEGREKDIYIPPFELQKVLGGDIVRARIVDFKGKKEIRVEKVLKRAKREIVGKVVKAKRNCILEPLDENAHLKFILSSKTCNEIEEGTVVVAKITQFPTGVSFPRAKVKEVIGNPNKEFIALELIIRKYNLPTEYPAEVLREIKELPSTIPEDEIKRRRDLRDQICFTIDPEKARDFDDAVAVELTPEGNYKLFVHIADVSYYVKENSATDKHAYERGFTFYLPHKALHMLPERLSADLCSLKPNEDRLTLTCEMIFDKKGELVYYDIYESVIKSKARLTYTEALSLIVGDPSLESRFAHVVKPLRLMEDLYRILSRRRWEKGSIDFDLPEAEVIVDEYGEPTAVIPYERHIAHRIIEQFMIAANETVAMHLENSGYPCLYRIHEPPDEERVENLLEILAGLGYTLRKPREFSPKFFQKIIEDFEGRPEEQLVRFLTLRAMSRAKYSPHNLGHFGLASDHYAHFTSPIRRYPDILVHRLVKKSLKGEQVNYEKCIGSLEEAGNYLSQRERLADEVEWEALDILKARYMKSRLGEVFEGIITGVVQFGFFVELREILVEGLVRINTLTDDNYLFDEPAHRFVGMRTGKVYRLGDKVRVKVLAVDEERGKIELMLADPE